jgi:glycine cleavage system H protein
VTIPEDLKYLEDHQWVRVETGVVTVGITDHGARMMGDFVFIEVAVNVGSTVTAGEPCGSVESVKSVSEIYAPVTGELVAINQALLDDPSTLNQDPYGEWIFKQKPAGQLPTFLDAAAYARFIKDSDDD